MRVQWNRRQTGGLVTLYRPVRVEGTPQRRYPRLRTPERPYSGWHGVESDVACRRASAVDGRICGGQFSESLCRHHRVAGHYSGFEGPTSRALSTAGRERGQTVCIARLDAL